MNSERFSLTVVNVISPLEISLLDVDRSMVSTFVDVVMILCVSMIVLPVVGCSFPVAFLGTSEVPEIVATLLLVVAN